MSKIQLNDGYCEFRCPGCNQIHVLSIGENAPHPKWVFTGSADSPTLMPSILARGMLIIFDDDGEWTGGWQLDATGNLIPYVCHSFVTEGQIRFLGDCTHELAGQTVTLPDF